MAGAKDYFLFPEDMSKFIVLEPLKQDREETWVSLLSGMQIPNMQKNEFVPSVLEFISECDRNGCRYINKVYTEEMLSKAYEGEKSVDELTELAKEMNTPAEEALKLY